MQLRIFCRFLALGVFAFACVATAQTEIILNGGFESGSSTWTLSGAAVNSAAGSSAYAHLGSKYLILGNANNANDSGYQDVVISSTATVAMLTYYYNITSFETSTTTAFDKFTNTIRNTSGVILATVGTWSNLNKDPDQGNPYYHLKSFDLLPYKGSTVRIHFAGKTDYADYTTFRVDDVSVQITVPPPPAPDPVLRSVTGVPASIQLGQSFTVTVTAENDAGTGGQYSAINASVLYSDRTDDLGVSGAQAPWADNLIVYQPSDGPMANNACNIVAGGALDHLIEAVDNIGSQPNSIPCLSPIMQACQPVTSRIPLGRLTR